ncbi:Molybdopterin-guanine dinucleotide biosynthesis adapter protein [Vibrio aerogenes CECT 7868]|uniref:Molybdopterin-guanine dinucleotide biosynthesis adapter protein n=1 Tax=Vibrio aerogenes CECT 7868 TaxID=1216006 RepID=A0A1M5Z6Z2_9VIBR|nr:molybdopterin-guanine dinucleotide biosynthesis protein B [Vibrio aerogenes]SHI20012.1 Molybdopterin-guanine dinucleotide biosynthesis adapter protein [Vibrio aerogenes CECT 7868]
MSKYSRLPAIPVIGFAAFSGTGKTTLLEKLIPQLISKGVRVGVYKHSHHVVELDKPGKDSFRLRASGAAQTLLSTPERSILTTEKSGEHQVDFFHLLHQFDTDALDVILVEGCKEQHFPKIELHRQITGKPWLYVQDPDIIAVACDSPAPGAQIPVMDLNDINGIALFVANYIHTFAALPE